MFADSFKITESEDGIFYEVEGKVSHEMYTDHFFPGLTILKYRSWIQLGRGRAGCDLFFYIIDTYANCPF